MIFTPQKIEPERDFGVWVIVNCDLQSLRVWDSDFDFDFDFLFCLNSKILYFFLQNLKKKGGVVWPKKKKGGVTPDCRHVNQPNTTNWELWFGDYIKNINFRLELN